MEAHEAMRAVTAPVMALEMVPVRKREVAMATAPLTAETSGHQPLRWVEAMPIVWVCRWGMTAAHCWHTVALVGPCSS